MSRRLAPLVVMARSTPRPSRVSTHAQGRQLGDEGGEMGPHRRFASGQADAVHPEALDAHPGHPLDLLEGEDVGARAASTMPSSGMQYWQRKLHRSVTEMRRSRTVRP